MLTTEEILAKFLFLFLKHLSIELNNLTIITNHQQLPKKSILRNTSDKYLSINQNNSIHLTQQIESFHRRRVLFTHVDSFEFDPQIPCRFLRQPQRQQLSSSSNHPCLCHQHYQSKATYPNKYQLKLKRQQK